MPRDAAQVHFDTLAIEGGLFTAEWLGKVANFAAPAQGDADYGVRAGFTLREEIALGWRSAQALWAQFDKARVSAGHDAAAVTQRFVAELLKQSFGFQLHAAPAPVSADGRSFPVNHFAFEGTLPVIAGVHTLALDTADPRFGDPTGTRRRRSAFGLLQEYLNAQNTSLWGIASNGVLLRVARDNASLTRPAWLEADLERLFQEERFAEFSVLWLLLHATRFGGENVAPSECVLERWRDACRDQGIRARDVLRQGVEQALFTLGSGFLSHHANTALREALASSRLTTRDFFQQLLRLVYRQIFLLTIEERGILHREDSDPAARELYAEGYSLRRLRDRAVRRNAHDRHHDLWEGLKLVWTRLAAGEPRLALPALGGLFGESQCRALDGARLENRHLLLALFHLAWLRDKDQPNAPLTRVNWRDMGPEELGSIYESLLELVPQIGDGSRSFSFLQGAETRGNARKTTGSYYTPDILVQLLLDSALEPVVAGKITTHPTGQAAVDALLSITVVDPACGSGHFLLAAARRIATHLARVLAENNGSGQPTPPDYRHALRQVVGRCIFGVDLNPMAVELCKVSLWLEAVEPGLPLTFLNSHIQHGNALLGTTPELMANGIPDTAWEPIEGDDNKIASALKKRNKKASEGQRSLDTLWSKPSDAEARAVARAVDELEAASDANPEALAKKESKWDGILGSAEYRHQKFVADAWCAAFVWPKQPGDLADAAPTNELWRQLRDGQGQPSALTTKTVSELAEQYGFFHWHLQFPRVFGKGGFDVVMGNPPWDKIQPEEEKFFAAPRPDIALAPSAKVRKALIAALPEDDPSTYRSWAAYKRLVDCTCHFLRSSGRLSFTGDGNLNSYRIFTESAAQFVAPWGRVGLVAQSGLATDESGKELFDFLLRTGRLCRFLDFENREAFFPDVDSRMRFCLITIRGKAEASSPPHDRSAEFGWLLHRIDELGVNGRLVRLTAEDLLLFNPSSRTSPVFTSTRDVEISRRIYGRGQHVMIDDAHRLARIEFLGELFNMTRDSALFMKQRPENSLPLYEAKFIHQFDHRYASAREGVVSDLTEIEKQDASLFVAPKSFVDASIVNERATKRGLHSKWMLGFRDIASATNERTSIAAVFPFAAVGNSTNLILGLSAEQAALFVANVNAFVFDFCARQKISGTHVNIWIFKQLPAIPFDGYDSSCRWLGAGQSCKPWISSRSLELTYTAWDLEPFAHDVGHDGPPFRWDPMRRFLLRCELDAAFFHLYGLSHDDADYVMDTFPIVRKNDERAYSKYRTKRVILEIYDAMAEAAHTGLPYQTRLDPPPADALIAHSETTRPAWAKGPDRRQETAPTEAN